MSLLHLSGSTGSLRPVLILTSITRPLHINAVQARLHKHLCFLLRPRHDILFQFQPLADSSILLRPLTVSCRVSHVP